MVNPPACLAPLDDASMTPLSPPQIRIAPFSAINWPTLSLWTASRQIPDDNCCTPGNCPPEEIYVRIVLQDGSETLVKIPKGALDDRETYWTPKELQEELKKHQQAY